VANAAASLPGQPLRALPSRAARARRATALQPGCGHTREASATREEARWLEVHEAPLLLEMEGADGCRAQGLPTRMYAAQKTGCASEYATPLPLRRIFDLIASFAARSASALESPALRRVQNSDMKLPTGTDHGNNLYAAHIRCNREKGTVAPRTARRWYGRTRAPHLGLRANGESTKTGSRAAASVC